MSTPNFYKKDASLYYVFCPEPYTGEDEDGNEITIEPDENDYDCFIENTIEHLHEALGKDFSENSKPEYTDDRNYGGRYLGMYDVQKDYAGISCEVILNPLVRSAYYQGCNLDFEIRIIVGNTEFDELPEVFDILDEMRYSSDQNSGICAMTAPKAWTWLDNTLDAMKTKLEKVFAECTETYRCVAVASNGQAMYEKVE